MPRTRRPRPRDADATRQLLLDAATEVFAEDGFAGARVDEIAKRSGVNKALIYAYYGDKEGLYRAVLSSRLAAPIPSLTQMADPDPRKGLAEVVRRYFKLLLDDRTFARLLAWGLIAAGARERDALLEAARPFLTLVDDRVRRARESGALPADVDPELFRTAVVSAAVGYSLQHGAMKADRARTGARFTDDEFVDFVCRLFLGSDPRAASSTRERRAR
jgi:TetR/AcrR family transcriptional regulator